MDTKTLATSSKKRMETSATLRIMKKNASTSRTPTSNPLLQETIHNLTTIRKEVDGEWKKLDTIKEYLKASESRPLPKRKVFFDSGSDPGMVVTSSSVGSSGSSVLASINQYTVLYGLDDKNKDDEDIWTFKWTSEKQVLNQSNILLKIRPSIWIT
ncbi:hypothetical protein BDA99DRAFT_574085 [Phascolomyces articulosus]|uniref:Uncharacterized protein n=1 Tax=Phascolomyces articulosus TaxID=60185 RepID=A0AAD5JUS8_9FUNG|nr:hypothetical protein BDA99DRAFT_574085 [Phascolomyces articulosus]